MTTTVDRALPTEDTLEQFYALLRGGNYIKTACEYAGIPESSYYKWMQEASTEEGRAWTKDLREQVQAARSYAQAANLQIVQQAAREGHWQAAAWFLERSNPSQWALRERRELEISVDVRTIDSRGQLAVAVAQLGVELIEDDELFAERAPGADARSGAPIEAFEAEPGADGPGAERGVVVRRSA